MSINENMRRALRSVTKDWVIGRLRANGMSVAAIAAKTKWSQSTVRRSIKKTSGWMKVVKA